MCLRKINKVIEIILLLMLCLPGVASLPTGSFEVKKLLSEIPDGFTKGRTGAPYGTYQSVVNPDARELQNELSTLESKIHALPLFLVGKDQMRTSEILLLIESEIIRLHLQISHQPDQKLSLFERQSFLSQTIRLYRQLRIQDERIYNDMIRFIDVALPGPNGLQIRQDLADGSSLYQANYRRDTVLTPAEQDQEYKEKLQAFLNQGGQLSEIFELTPQKIAEFPGFAKFEYVQLQDGSVRATFGHAGHILLSGGHPILTAGQMVILKDAHDKLTLLVITNASGSFKPDMTSTENLIKKLQELYHLSATQIVQTFGEPLSSQPLKIYMKALAQPKEDIKNRTQKLEELSKQILFSPPGSTPSSCRRVLMETP